MGKNYLRYEIEHSSICSIEYFLDFPDIVFLVMNWLFDDLSFHQNPVLHEKIVINFISSTLVFLCFFRLA